jgi:hypothetical protein
MQSGEDRLKARLMGRLHDLEYVDVTDFWRQTKTNMSHETVRRALHGGKPVSVESYIKIAANLNFSPKEIANMIKEYTGDAFWPSMLAGGELSDSDRVLLRVVHRVFAGKPDLWNHFLGNLRLYSQVVGVDIAKDLEQLVRPLD